MEWQLIVALVIMVPIVVLPVALVWYLNLGGMRLLLRAVRRGKLAGKDLFAPADPATVAVGPDFSPVGCLTFVMPAKERHPRGGGGGHPGMLRP